MYLFPMYRFAKRARDGRERVRWVAARRVPGMGPVAVIARPDLQRSIVRLLDGSFKPRVTTLTRRCRQPFSLLVCPLLASHST